MSIINCFALLTGTPPPEGDIGHRADHTNTGGMPGHGSRVLRKMLPAGLQNAQAAYTHAA